MNIIIDTANFKFNHSGSSTGLIHICHKDRYFPDEHWNDFPAVILGWWNEGLAQLLEYREHGIYEMNFMDGPYNWKLEYNGSNSVEVTFNRFEKPEFNFDCDLSEIIGTVITSTNSLLRYCTEHSMMNDDIENLREQFRKLQANSKLFPYT